MKEFNILKRLIVFLTLLLISGFVHGQILVSGTDFDPFPGNESRYYIGLPDIKQIGLQPGTINSTPPLAANVNPGIFNPGYFYAITPTPIRLDSVRYQDFIPEDYSYVYAPPATSPGGNVNILSYSLTGLVPGSPVSVIVDYCSAVKATYAACTGQRNEFKAGINLDANNQLNGNDAAQIGMGQCQSATFTGTADASGNMVFRMNNTRFGSCQAMAIKKIRIMGTPLPQIFSAQGTEVCAGEQITLQSKLSYEATYQWQVNTGSGWTNITGGTNKAQLYEVLNAAVYQFRLQVTPLTGGPAITSSAISVTGKQCCEINGVSASRQTIYYDNFGRVDLTDKTGTKYFVWDYSDVLNPVEVAKTTTTPFRWPLTPAPLGAIFRGGPGPLNDGDYCVAAYLTGYNPDNGYAGARLEWANRVTGPQTPPEVSLDHSGQKDGACLFLNCPAGTQNQTIYSRNITDLCFGKQLDFEAWIAVFTNSAGGAYQGVDVTVRLTDGGNPANIVTLNATATRQESGGGIWVPIRGSINLVGTSLLMEVINNSSVSANGNDLVIDDIKIMACSPPSIGLFFDIPTLDVAENVCTTPISLNTKASELLKEFYNNAPRYLYQWSRTPLDVTSWKNYGTPMTAETFAIANPQADPAFATLVNGNKVYFRVIAATALIFTANTNFVAPNFANKNDPCKNYSVSDPIEATVLCPSCSKPTVVTITAPATSPRDICQGTAQTLSGSATVTAASLNGGFRYSWIKTAGTTPGVKVTPTIIAIPANAATAMPSYTGITGLIADAGTYVLRVEDGNTGNAACYTEATVVINVNPTPTITGTLTVCQGLTTALTGSGTPHATTPWTSATTTVATVSNTGVVTGMAAGTSVITYRTSAGCTQTATVTVNAKPTISGTLTVCQGLTTTLTGSGTPHTTTPWTSATTTVATVSNTGVVTGIGAGTSVITYMNSNGCTEVATVTVNAKPTIGGTLTVCQGLTTTLTGSGTAHATTPWASATTSVATISNTGVVTGVGAGTSVITYMTSAGCTEVATVTVSPTPTISGTLTVCQGLTTTLTGSGTAHATTPWTSATTTVATVSATGVVTGMGAGTSVITYRTSAGCIATATVTVIGKPTISGTLTVCRGLTTTLTGSGTAHATTPWASATTTVATVSATGVVTGVAAGTSVITYMNSTGCTETATVTVNPTPTISGTLTVCAGSTTQLTGSGTAASSNGWVSATTTVASVSNTGLVTGIGAGTSVITYTTNSGCVQTATVTVNASPVPSVSIATPSTTICTGTSVTFTATPVNGGTPTYQWYKGAVPGTPIASETGATFTTTTAANNDRYYVVMNSTATCANPATATSNVIVMSVTTVVTPAVSITAAPAGPICAGTSVTFTAVGGNGGNDPTYEWFIKKTTDATAQSQGAAALGATTFTRSNLTNGDEVSVRMVSNSPCVVAPGTATSNVITMTVNPNVTPTVTLTADKTTICPGDLVTYTATSTNGGTPTYTWTGTPTAAGTGPTYSTTALAAGNSVTVRVNSTLTCVTAATATSTPVVVTVTPVPTIGVTISPDVTSICANNPVVFTATATGSGSTPAPTYRWFITSSNTTTPAGTPQGAASTTATTFTTSALTAANNKVYVEVVSNATCASPTAVASNVVAITVNTGITAGSIGSDKTICYNSPVGSTFTELTSSSAVTPTYVWESSLNGSSGWGTAAGTPGNGGKDFTPTGNLTSDLYYHRVVTDASAPGLCNTATSNTIRITVRAQLVAGIIGSSEITCSGSPTATMSQTTAPTGGTGTYTYQWESAIDNAGAPGTPGTFGPIAAPAGTAATYNAGSLTSTMYYRLVETSGACGNVTTNIIKKEVTPKEALTAVITTPQTQICVSAGAVVFTATGTSTPAATPASVLSYQWYLGPVIPANRVGTNSPSYTYTPVAGDNGKSIRVVVSTSNTCNQGPVTSAPYVLDIVSSVTPTVAITTPNNPNCAGLLTTFTATSTGGGTIAPGPTYQWYVNNNPVGTGGTTYSTTTLVDGAIVHVELTSTSGCLSGPNPFPSNKITMDIKPIPAPSITEPDQIICSPASFTFHGVAGTGTTLEWRSQTSAVVGTGINFTATQSGTYVLYEDNGTCNSTSAPVTLTIIQAPQANAGEDIYIKQGDKGRLQGSGGAIYSWTPSTYLTNAGIPNPGFTATQTITYVLTVSDASGTCTDDDEVTVIVVSPIKVPNVITVNGDGSNDTWELENIEGYPNCIIEIYNRWGNLVWKSEGYPKNWDGTNFRNGEVLSEGTYFYIIDLQSQIYDEPLTGWIQIIK